MPDPHRRWAECYLPAAVCGGNPWGSACAGVIVGSMYDHVVGMWLRQLSPAGSTCLSAVKLRTHRKFNSCCACVFSKDPVTGLWTFHATDRRDP